jgi:hypothetical protein
MARPLTLTDALADHHGMSRVSAICASCGHVATVDIWALGVKLG